MSASKELCILTLLCLFLISNYSHAQKITVGANGDYPNLAAAGQVATAGDTIELQSQVFANGSQFLYDLEGTEDAPIVIIAKEMHQAIFSGGTEAIHLVRCNYVEINGIVAEGQTGNGINIDDGGDYESTTEHITVRNCIFRDMEASGNNDLLKMSGVDNFLIESSMFLNGGTGGSGVDFVGCHHGVVQDCLFDNAGTTGIQNKGGTQHIRIQRNVFKNMEQRALNLGGSTSLEFFRPPLSDPIENAFEAADIEVTANVFVGNRAPIAYVGAVRIHVFNNTFYKPENWVFRILQETTEEGFLPCSDNTFRNNIIYLENDLTEVNIGPNTSPETFELTNNLWFKPGSSTWTPVLPVEDINQIIADPLFVNSQDENFTLDDTSPAIGSGFILDNLSLDFNMQPFNSPPSIGAFEGGGITSKTFEQERMGNIHMYPNPARRDAQIQLELEEEDLLVMLYDMSGKIILSQSSLEESMDLSKLSLKAGQYIIKAVSNEGKTYASKLFLY